jgi:hypothetical protein
MRQLAGISVRVCALTLLLSLACAGALLAQTARGELRIRVTDPAGLGVRTSVEISSEANQYRNTLATNEAGELNVARLPYGIYRVAVHQAGFADVDMPVEIRSSIAATFAIQLRLPSVAESIAVNEQDTLVNPEQAGAVDQIGYETIQTRLSSLPGRSLQDLVNSQPGWLYEGNAVLHPRGSEYQTQFVVDGIPLTDNRSPSFGPEIGAENVQSMTIFTAGFPAEYGRKMGGVVEVNTMEDAQQGFHGQVALSGGSYWTAGSYAQGQYVWGKNTLGASASGSMTDHYLNPVVPENYSNTATLGDFAANYQRELSSKDRLSFSVRHEESRYDIPNELIQQAAGQRQNADNMETMGIVSYQHTFNSNAVANVRGMVRDNANDFYSNAASTPIYVTQHNWFREGYFLGSVTVKHGRHEFKFGVESDNTFLNENFAYVITDPTQFDPDTPPTFQFSANRPDLEQSAYVQDLIRLGNWTVSAGLRWDHYQLMINRQAVDPRVAVSRYFPSVDLVVHFSYDRVFQTPSNENILLSSSPQAAELNGSSLQIPVEPSEGNYYEAGLSKGLWKRLRVDANYYRRLVNNYADDDQIENTTISFPIAFRKSIIYGAEAKLDVPNWNGWSGFVSYSWTVGNAWFPVTGGLFLGGDAELPTTGHFPDSQDQRNTVRGRARYQLTKRIWLAAGIQFDSGLPFEFDGTYDEAVAQYGQAVVDRINFARGRIDPAFQVNVSGGADFWQTERLKIRMQVDGQNLNNVLNVIDFGGLFSGNAIGPGRSVAVRVVGSF